MKPLMKSLLMLELMLVLVFLFAGCSNVQENEQAKIPAPDNNQTRFNIVSRQVIVDSRGYSRDILMLKDSITGREYLAVMGAGVAENRTQSSGKNSRTIDE